MRNCVIAGLWGLFVVANGWLCVPAEGKPIEAIRGKEYRVTERHGPWMIMVTSFSGVERQDDARDAASQLVYALRKKGIPAYSYEQETKLEHVSTPNTLGQAKRRVYASQRPMIAVLAGNYKAADDSVAQKTLAWIKDFEPMLEYKSTKTGEVTSAKFPLKKAFLARNPLLQAEESSGRVKDPLLLQLNSGTEHSLLSNKGRYTLVVASFYGNSQIKPINFASFDTKLQTNSKLDAAALEAWQLCKTLQTHQRIRELRLDAWVLHERYRSVVTVGSFEYPDDPRIQRAREIFGAKYQRFPKDSPNGKEVLVSESIQIPGNKPGDLPLRNWILDPEPKLIEVPKVR